MPQTPQATAPDWYLLDTNILARLTERTSRQHQTAADAVRILIARGALLFITPQNFGEFWSLTTRPTTKNGMGLTAATAAAEFANHKGAFRMLPDAAATFAQWERLVSTYNVTGPDVHDARLAAVALVYQVPHVLTFNGKHFRRFAPEGLKIVDPATIANATQPTTGTK
jgi:predicted nucleic acid-binding protein